MTQLYVTREDFFGEDPRVNNKPIRHITRYYYINNDYGKYPEIAKYDSKIGILAVNEEFILSDTRLSIYKRAMAAPIYSDAFRMLLDLSKIGPDAKLATYKE